VTSLTENELWSTVEFVLMKHIIWDWNGTLLNDTHLVVEATNTALAAFGVAPVSLDEHRRDFIRPVERYYSAVIGRDLTEDEFGTIEVGYHRAYEQLLPSCPLTFGAVDVLSGWTGRQSLLSMWFHDRLVPTVETYGLSGYFARVDGLRATIGGGPKAPHLAAHLAAQGLVGTDCVLVGDSVDDAVAAASVGAECILYSGGLTDPARLIAVGVPVVDSLDDALREINRVHAGR
jgi:phosphoglycolate phosphatase-like HAD superfamily hydrolase